MAVHDLKERQSAVDPTQSFIVQAPAGSGKTSLLTQRILKLLTIVDQPEEILAITFTRKATAEMKNRVIEQLIQAQNLSDDEISQKPQYESELLKTAKEVLQRDQKYGWNLLQHASRLKIQTFDSFASSIVRREPIKAEIGLNVRIAEDTYFLYSLVAQRLIRMIDEESEHKEHIEYIKTALLYFDNNTKKFIEFITKMLAKRQQWMDLASKIFIENLYSFKDQESELLKLLNSRKTLVDGIASCFPEVSFEDYSDQSWKNLNALLHILWLAHYELQTVFEHENQVDFTSIAIGANNVLQPIDDIQISDTELKFDVQLKHILVDEFQDTSEGQVKLIHHLTAHWTGQDGKTLFFVGDPMQSIYKFRDADVSLFTKIQKDSSLLLNPNIEIKPLYLNTNFRSNPYIIDWVNTKLSLMFPAEPNIFKGEINYKKSMAGKSESDFNQEDAVHFYFNLIENNSKSNLSEDDQDNDNDSIEIQNIISIIQKTQRQYQNQKHKIAILVRSRSKVDELLTALRNHKIYYISTDIEFLAQKTIITELLALTRAILFPSDNIAWFATLRSRWLGLTLDELFHIREQLDSKEKDFQLVLSVLLNHSDEKIRQFGLIMQQSIEKRYQEPFSQLIKNVWLQLGGANQSSDEEFIDALKYFDFVKKFTEQYSLIDFDISNFERKLETLYAESIAIDPNAVEILTIHKSKGLEFDTVIIPHLGKQFQNYQSDILEISSSISDDYQDLLLMPKIYSSEKTDDALIYENISNLNKNKENYERIRLLYVAVTRAKKHLHLTGNYKISTDSKGKQKILRENQHYIGLMNTKKVINLVD